MDRNIGGSHKTQPLADRAPNRAENAGAAFWRFSLALYARPGVADALIALQDRAGLDVNLILFGLWVGVRHRHELGRNGYAAAAESVAEPSGVVRSIRALRRQLKDAGHSDIRRLRGAVLRVELAAERQVQQQLAACFAAGSLPGVPGDQRSAALANLAHYLGAEGDSPEAALLRREFAALSRRY
jgi:uncharacterized protein (TIGR02444 family)